MNDMISSDAAPADIDLLAFPDPVVGSDQLSGTAFLWFDKRISITMPPVVTADECWPFLDLVAEHNPPWAGAFFGLYETWGQEQDASMAHMKVLSELGPEAWRPIIIAYPSTPDVLDRSSELIEAAGMSLDSAAHVVNPQHAAGEVMWHILQEMFLTLDSDLHATYEYCDRLFTNADLVELLTKAYLLRMQLLQYWPWPRGGEILLTNHLLLDIFVALPVESDSDEQQKQEIARSVVAWELFRHVLRPYVDPLNEQRTALLAGLRRDHREEVLRLRTKCILMADHVGRFKDDADLARAVQSYIQLHVQQEIADLLSLDRLAVRDYVVQLFSDQKTWAGLLSAIGAALAGNDLVTAGGAIMALSSMGAGAVRAAAMRHEKLRTSDYGLVYSVANLLY